MPFGKLFPAVTTLPRAEFVGQGGGGVGAVGAVGEEVDVGHRGDGGAFLLAVDAARGLGDYLDALEGGAFGTEVAADEAVLSVGAAGAALVAVEDEPDGPEERLLVEAVFLDVAAGEGAGGLVAGGGLVLYCPLGGVHGLNDILVEKLINVFGHVFEYASYLVACDEL